MIRSGMTPTQVASAARKDVGQLKQHVSEKHADLERICRMGNSKEGIVRSGTFTSPKGLQWVNVITATNGGTTLYPLLWYATTGGLCAMQIDAEGPAQYFQPHVLDRYLKRYLHWKAGKINAIRQFHKHNYAKVFQPDAYKNDRDSYVAVIDDGYVAGENLKNDAILHFRTFYDKMRGRQRFGHLRATITWREPMKSLTFDHVGRRDTPHAAWGRGYRLRWEQQRMAA
ncbi:MAG: hypothetical protein ABI599_13350 [Flavobacteriales bacterium]